MLSPFSVVQLLLACAFLGSAAAQTTCSLKIPVPNLGYCDAIGALEEHVDAELYETRGHVSVMNDYQMDAFKLIDQQIRHILSESSMSESSVLDIQEELEVLKRGMKRLEKMHLEAQQSDEDETSSFSRRASSIPASQQKEIDDARTTFAQALAQVLMQVQTADKRLADEVRKDGIYHQQLLKELSDNERKLQQLEKELNTLEQTIQKAAVQGNKGRQALFLVL